MNAIQLKESILKEAISGRLVPQLDEEPTVEKIGTMPEKIPFKIPKKWKWIYLQEIQTLIRGITFPATAKQKNKTDNTVRCLTTGSVQKNYNDKADVYVDISFIKNKNQFLKEGDVIISSANSRELVGKNILWNRNKNISFGGFLTVARVKENRIISPTYLYIIYQFLFISGIFLEKATQTTNIANISNKIINKLPVPIPPLSEQKRIEKKLKQVLPFIEKYNEAQEKLNRLNAKLSIKLKTSLLKEAISGKLVPQINEEPEVKQIGNPPKLKEVPFIIPKKWKWVRLSNVGKIIGGGTPKTNIPEYWENGTIPWITPADLGKQNSWKISRGKKNISKLGYEKSSAKLLPAGTVIFSSRAPIGYAAIAQCDCTTNQGCKSFVPNKAVITSEWGYFSMIWATPNMKSRASEMTFKEISGKGVGETWIPLPPVQEQLRIVNKLSKILSIIDLQNIK